MECYAKAQQLYKDENYADVGQQAQRMLAMWPSHMGARKMMEQLPLAVHENAALVAESDESIPVARRSTRARRE